MTPPRRPRRVVHLTTVHPTFDSRIFHKECVSLADRGYDVTLVAVAEADAVVDGVYVRALRAPRSRWERMSLTAYRAWRIARSMRADLYHFHDPELIPVGLLLKLGGRRVVYDVHEDVPLDLLTKGYLPRRVRPALSALARAINRMAERAFDGIVVVTPSVGEPFRSPTMVRNFPRLAEFGALGPDLRERAPHAVYVGGISALRGIEQMRSAAELVRHPGFQLRLAGRVSPPGLLHTFEHDQSIAYSGELDRTGVSELLDSVQVGLVVLPGENVAYRTAYPIKLFEYMAAGIPAVASDFPVYRALVEEAACGLVVDPSDPAAIAEAIQWLLDNVEAAAEMGRRGRHAVEHHYNWEAERSALFELYEAIIEG